MYCSPIELFQGVAVGGDNRCRVVAEIGQNHNGDPYLLARLVGMCNKYGVDAIKLQKRDIPSDLTVSERKRPYDGPNSFGTTYGEHREKLELSGREWFALRERCAYNDWNVPLFATACDVPSVEMLERWGNPVYKVASRDLDNWPLLEAVAATGKPLILSTGMSDLARVERALRLVSRPVVLLHCVSVYPTPASLVNLRAMQALAQFGFPVGLSDHTAGIVTSVAAAAMGACLVEKHVTMARAMPGTDHAASLERKGLECLVKACSLTGPPIREKADIIGETLRLLVRSQARDAGDYVQMAHDVINLSAAMGDGRKVLLDEERPSLCKLGRSWVATRDLPAGHIIEPGEVCLKSPGYGVRPSVSVVGMRTTIPVPEDWTIRACDVRSVEVAHAAD